MGIVLHLWGRKTFYSMALCFTGCAQHRVSISRGSHNMSPCSLKPMKNKWESVITPITQFQQKLSAVTPRKESGLAGSLKPGSQREVYIHLSMRPGDPHILNPWHSAFFTPHLLPPVNRVNIHTRPWVCVHVFAILRWNYKALKFSVYLKNCGEWKCR